jgi:DmsE family decaheme c-type cytochrome
MKWFAFFCVFLLSFSTTTFSREPGETHTVKRTPSYTKEGSEACLRCHSGDAMRAVANSAHGNMENMYAPLATKGCEACHGPGSIHVSRAHGGAGFPKLIDFGRGKDHSPRDTQIEACLACHHDDKGGTSPIEWYNSSHNRPSINCSTCHTVHVEVDPMHDADQQVAKCNRCHRKDLEKHEHFEDVNIDFESLACGTCHNVHEAFDRAERHAAVNDMQH